jgi:hypothetical protein
MVTSIEARIVLEVLKLEGAAAADGLGKRNVSRIGLEYFSRCVTLLARHSKEGFLVICRSEFSINLEVLANVLLEGTHPSKLERNVGPAHSATVCRVGGNLAKPV